MPDLPVPALCAALMLSGLLPGAAAAQEFTTQTWRCERDVTIPVTTVMGDPGLVVLNVDGRQITLLGEEAASGARYAWPSDGSGYVWWTQVGTATLGWRDGTTGDESEVLSGCAPG